MIDEKVLLAESEEKQNEPVNFATVEQVYSDGVTLRFDGEDVPSQKRYKVNAFAVFATGDRVKIVRDSGTYIVEYPIGNPRTNFTAETAETANNALKLNGKSEADLSVYSAKSANKATTADNASRLNNRQESQLSVEVAKNFTGKHTGNGLSFFNSGNYYSKTTVRYPQAATVAALKTALDDLIQALKWYNLV